MGAPGGTDAVGASPRDPGARAWKPADGSADGVRCPRALLAGPVPTASQVQPMAMRGCAPGWIHVMIRSMAARGTDTQPAVAPEPLTWRKIPAPRPGVAGRRSKLMTRALAHRVGQLTRCSYEYQTRADGYAADLFRKTSPEGRAWQFGYDAFGNLTTLTDPKGVATTTAGDYTTSYAYDSYGQLTKSTDANGNPTTYSGFGPTGCPTTITDEDQRDDVRVRRAPPLAPPAEQAVPARTSPPTRSGTMRRSIATSTPCARTRRRVPSAGLCPAAGNFLRSQPWTR
ncbi:hypothetical protein GCM10019016_058700 [Streptomyces prasinosporus]|uniref:RHS repeat protein n=1 Tax=Streptomyces prasinosporus TaxID=68256 RepID=A0ABP6TUL0_9ACTN